MGLGLGMGGPCRAAPQVPTQPSSPRVCEQHCLHILCNVTDAFSCSDKIETQTWLRDKGFLPHVLILVVQHCQGGMDCNARPDRSCVQFIDLKNEHN